MHAELYINATREEGAPVADDTPRAVVVGKHVVGVHGVYAAPRDVPAIVVFDLATNDSVE